MRKNFEKSLVPGKFEILNLDRTSVKNRAELREALGVSAFDRVLDMAREILDSK